MPKDWRRQQAQDPFFRKAKREGYRARSAYKLQEIDDKFKLIHRSARVLDLGAAPGSWSQYIAQRAGPSARIVAVDLTAIEPIAGVQTIQGDISQPATVQAIQEALPDGADLVLSDVSPKISGVKLTDHVRSIELARASLDLAREFCKTGGAFVVKVFQGEDFQAFVAEARAHFQSVKVYRPKASREESNEHYVVCLGLKK